MHFPQFFCLEHPTQPAKKEFDERHGLTHSNYNLADNSASFLQITFHRLLGSTPEVSRFCTSQTENCQDDVVESLLWILSQGLDSLAKRQQSSLLNSRRPSPKYLQMIQLRCHCLHGQKDYYFPPGLRFKQYIFFFPLIKIICGFLSYADDT